MMRWSLGLLLLVGLCGCAVDVADLTIAAPHPPLSADAIRNATSRGWRDGDSCRFWLLGPTFGLPKVDEAMDDAMNPVHGVFMRDTTVLSVHPFYLFFGWHCYHVHGEVFG